MEIANLLYKQVITRLGSIFYALVLMFWLDFHGAIASNIRLDDEQFHHSSWGLKEGAPTDIWAIIQAKDGYLLLGTGCGLYRFDGVRFERYSLPSGEKLPPQNITALTQLPNGDLWIGLFSGGVRVIHDGRVIDYSRRNGFPDAMVIGFIRDGDGGLWAATRDGLVRFEGDRWQVVGKDWNYPAKRADWLLVDAVGTLWVTTGETLMFLRKGSRQFESTGMKVGSYAVLAQAPDGKIWISDKLHGVRSLLGLSAAHPVVGSEVQQPETSFAQAKRMLFDREGKLWATDAHRGGVYQVAAPGRVHSGRALHQADLTIVANRMSGLTSDFAVPLLQDREGTLWVGTNSGLDSFRHSSVNVPKKLILGPSSNFGLASDSHGIVWIANAGKLFRIEHARPTLVLDGLGDVGGATVGGDDTLWMSSVDLLKVKHARMVRVPLLNRTSAAEITAMASDNAGGLWASFSFDKSIRHFTDGKWLTLPDVPLLTNSVAICIATDAKGGVWFGYSENRIAYWDGSRTQVFSQKDGLHIGDVTSIHPMVNGVLIGGRSGLAFYSKRRFRSITSSNEDVLAGISGIAQLRNGDVWLNTSKGVVRIHAADLQQALDHPDQHLDYRLFDHEDGLPGIALQDGIAPTAGVDADERLWFATNQGVAWIDPAQIRSNIVPPPVDIQSLIADGHIYPPIDTVRLPKRTTNVQIEYTALSLSIPQRVRFRYRLDDVDKQWQDVGNRREAFYTNLKPGTYHFRVIAANDDGLWNERGSSIVFIIPPRFYQTNLFMVLCVSAGVMMLLALFLWRLRQLTLRVHDRLEERHQERERIARELHDTLLQSIQGLVLRFQAAAERISKGDPVRAMIDKALDRADDVLIEGRDRVRDLRTTAQMIRMMPQALTAIGEELAQGRSIDFRVVMDGPIRMLNPIVSEEIYQIGREALTNAFLHAAARLIEVEISYNPDNLRLRVRDDGVGIDQQIVVAGGKPGHWGLSGMRERALGIGAKLDIWSRSGLGTEISLQVPASVAYCDGRRPYLSWLRRLVIGGRYG